MVTTLLHTAVLSSLQALVNSLLALDLKARQKLAPLSGQVLQVHCLFPDLTVNIVVCDDSLSLSRDDVGKPDTVISGKPSALIKLLITRDASSLKKEGIEVRGSTALLNELQEILSHLDIDWEYQLSKLIGDIPTQTVSDGLSSARQFTARTGNNLRQDIDDYLHEERKLFPTSAQVNQFYDAIDNMRLRLDRLGARIDRLAATQSPAGK